ncbi:MAG: hypothetical protein LBR53_12605 [Deltaproteobacteria bacterium]|nr:hypothetical protein [Deltaproteobacteria bacterium]
MGKRKTEEGANHPDRDGQFRLGVLWKLSPWKLATSASPRSSAPPTPAAGTTTPGGSSPSSVSTAHADGSQRDPRGLGQARKPRSRGARHGLGLVRGAHEMATAPSPADL